MIFWKKKKANFLVSFNSNFPALEGVTSSQIVSDNLNAKQGKHSYKVNSVKRLSMH